MAYSDQEYLIGLRQGDSKVISALHDFISPSIEKMVLSNSGSVEDARDLAQEVLLAMLKKVRGNLEFELTSKLSTFLLAMARFQWLKQLRRKKTHQRMITILNGEYKYLDDLDLSVMEQELLRAEKVRAAQIALRNLKEPCKTLINNDIKGVTDEEASKTFNISKRSYHVKKSRCYTKLRMKAEELGFFNI